MHEASCAICNKPGGKPCQRCKSIAYCSKDCQSKDWPCHKLLCAQFATAIPPQPPGADTAAGKEPGHRPHRQVRGILFDPTAKQPRLIWAQCHHNTDEETGVAFQDVDVERFLSTDLHETPGAISTESRDWEPERLYCEHNYVRDHKTESFLEFWHREQAWPPQTGDNQQEFPESNLAIVAATGGKMSRPWRGPVVVMAMTPASGAIVDSGFYKDATMLDFRDAVDYLAHRPVSVGDLEVDEDGSLHVRKAKG